MEAAAEDLRLLGLFVAKILQGFLDALVVVFGQAPARVFADECAQRDDVAFRDGCGVGAIGGACVAAARGQRRAGRLRDRSIEAQVEVVGLAEEVFGVGQHPAAGDACVGPYVELQFAVAGGVEGIVGVATAIEQAAFAAIRGEAQADGAAGAFAELLDRGIVGIEGDGDFRSVERMVAQVDEDVVEGRVQVFLATYGDDMVDLQAIVGHAEMSAAIVCGACVAVQCEQGQRQQCESLRCHGGPVGVDPVIGITGSMPMHGHALRARSARLRRGPLNSAAVERSEQAAAFAFGVEGIGRHRAGIPVGDVLVVQPGNDGVRPGHIRLPCPVCRWFRIEGITERQCAEPVGFARLCACDGDMECPSAGGGERGALECIAPTLQLRLRTDPAEIDPHHVGIDQTPVAPDLYGHIHVGGDAIVLQGQGIDRQFEIRLVDRKPLFFRGRRGRHEIGAAQFEGKLAVFLLFRDEQEAHLRTADRFVLQRDRFEFPLRRHARHHVDDAGRQLVGLFQRVCSDIAGSRDIDGAGHQQTGFDVLVGLVLGKGERAAGQKSAEHQKTEHGIAPGLGTGGKHSEKRFGTIPGCPPARPIRARRQGRDIA